MNCPNTEMPSSNPIIYDSDKCTGCNRCVEICQADILAPDTVKGGHPIVLFPDECWYCGCCVMECPVKGAISLRHPLMNRVHWIAKDSLTD